MNVTAAQLRAGRALLNLSQVIVAERAGVSVSTLKRLEAAPGPLPGLHATISAVTGALEAGGIVFGPGVSVSLERGRVG